MHRIGAESMHCISTFQRQLAQRGESEDDEAAKRGTGQQGQAIGASSDSQSAGACAPLALDKSYELSPTVLPANHLSVHDEW